MKKHTYSRFEDAELILRDELAIDRTLLANERTLLAYLRAGVALAIAGISIIHFADTQWFKVVGILCLPVSAVSVSIGIARFSRMNSAISHVREHSPQHASGRPRGPEGT